MSEKVTLRSILSGPKGLESAVSSYMKDMLENAIKEARMEVLTELEDYKNRASKAEADLSALKTLHSHSESRVAELTQANQLVMQAQQRLASEIETERAGFRTASESSHKRMMELETGFVVSSARATDLEKQLEKRPPTSVSLFAPKQEAPVKPQEPIPQFRFRHVRGPDGYIVESIAVPIKETD